MLPSCYDDLPRKRNHNGLLDSSSRGKSMVLYQQPLYSCFRWFLNGLFTTSSTCSCDVIPLSITTRSVLMEQMVTGAFISGGKCLLNAFKTNIPCFLKSTPGPLFHPANNQSFISSLVIQHLDGHLTNIPSGSCSMDTVLWFRITMVATCYHLLLPPQQLHIPLHNLIFESPQILPHHW